MSLETFDAVLDFVEKGVRAFLTNSVELKVANAFLMFKQLSVVIRDHALASEPELQACAAMFSVK